MDAMFEDITAKMNRELTEHSGQLDRLETKSKQFDRHMKDLREANNKEMVMTDQLLAKVLRNDGAGTIEPGFAMGR